MRLGATDFLIKPIGIDHLRRVLKRALHERNLEDEVAALRERTRHTAWGRACVAATASRLGVPFAQEMTRGDEHDH